MGKLIVELKFEQVEIVVIWEASSWEFVPRKFRFCNKLLERNLHLLRGISKWGWFATICAA